MLAGMALKWPLAGPRGGRRQVDRDARTWSPVRCRSAGTSSARYFDVELREVPMEPGPAIAHARARPLHACDENTIGVVPTLGVTFTCHYEPVQEICEALDRLQQRNRLDIPIHVDAASGGFVAPFCSPICVWDFRLPRVKSINASGHKFGLAPLGCGWVIWREQSRPAGGPDLQGQLSRRRHADVRPELLAAGRADCRPVLQFPAAWQRRLSQGPAGLSGRSRLPCR